MLGRFVRPVFLQNHLQPLLVASNQVLVPVHNQRGPEKFRGVDARVLFASETQKRLVNLLVLVLGKHLEPTFRVHARGALDGDTFVFGLVQFVVQQGENRLQHVLLMVAVDAMLVDLFELVERGHLLCHQVDLKLVFVVIQTIIRLLKRRIHTCQHGELSIVEDGDGCGRVLQGSEERHGANFGCEVRLGALFIVLSQGLVTPESTDATQFGRKDDSNVALPQLPGRRGALVQSRKLVRWRSELVRQRSELVQMEEAIDQVEKLAKKERLPLAVGVVASLVCREIMSR